MPTDTPLADILATISADIDKRLVELCEEAAFQRESVKGNETSRDVLGLHEELLRCRAALDRVEGIVADLGRLRARTVQALEDRQGALEDAEAQVVSAKQVGFSDEYATAKQKNALISNKTVAETLAVRRAKKIDRDVGAALDYCRFLHRGLEGVRRDLDTRIRLMTIEGYLG